jgi:hypothetical protein
MSRHGNMFLQNIIDWSAKSLTDVLHRLVQAGQVDWNNHIVADLDLFGTLRDGVTNPDDLTGHV